MQEKFWFRQQVICLVNNLKRHAWFVTARFLRSSVSDSYNHTHTLFHKHTHTHTLSLSQPHPHKNTLSLSQAYTHKRKKEEARETSPHWKIGLSHAQLFKPHFCFKK